jgi:dienelactone hydrolase
MMKTVEFMSSNHRIQGYFFPAAGNEAIATVLFLQGFPGVEGDELICERLAQKRVHVLSFNYRGTFASEGYFSFSHAVADIGAALRFLQESQVAQTYRIDPQAIILGGWSFGSGIVLAEAVQAAHIRRIFAISGRDFGQEARKVAQDAAYAETVTRNLAAMRAPEGPVHFRDDLTSDLINNQATFTIEQQLPSLKDRDILLLGAWDDEINPIEDHLLPLYRSLTSKGIPSHIAAFKDGHGFSDSKDQLVQEIIHWLGSE